MQPVTVLGAVWLVNYENFVLNHVLVWMRSGMAVNCGFTK